MGNNCNLRRHDWYAIILLTACVLGFYRPYVSYGGANVGTVQAVEGRALCERASQAEAKPLSPGDALHAGDIIRTEGQSKILLQTSR